eukprot:12663473-Ditylum_brightwellii.AAC.1
MESSIRKEEKPEICQANKEDSTANSSNYCGPILHEEETISSYSSYSALKSYSSDVEIAMKPSTWKEKKTKKKMMILMRVHQVTAVIVLPYQMKKRIY